MKALTAIGREVFGLFVDDGSLAIAILVWVGLIAALVFAAALPPALTGILLFAGLIAILLENILRRVRAKP
jgi:hypothetical protein